MTIKECIDIVDNAKPNQYSIKEKVMWLSFVDETIINDVLKTHEGYDGRYDNFEGYTEDKLSVPLIVPSPYDRLYPQYIKMMIDSENGETARYNNSAALYNTYLNEYKKYYNKTHMPLDATQKVTAPVNININSGLSEAQIENIKRQLYYMLSEDFSEATSRDKLYDIVTNYVLNNLEIFKKYVGKDGKDGSKIIAYPLGFGTDVAVGHEEVLPDELYGKVNHLDIVIDTEGNCIFQYKAYEGDGEVSLPAESFRCIANPNPESGGVAGEGCVMKFMKEVSALPETANDGEVYSVNPWGSAGAYDGSGTKFNNDNVLFEGWNALGNALYQDIQNHYAQTYKFVLSNGTELIYKECTINSVGEWGFEMGGNCTDSNINLTLANGEIVDVYRINGEPKDNDSYVRFNNKWIKL